MRILHVVSRSQRRGAEIVAVDLARLLDERGFGNRVIALAPGFDGRTEPGLPALTTHRRGGPVALLTAARALRRELRERPVDAVFAHGGRAVEAAVLAGGGPTVIWQRVLGFPPDLWRLPRRWWWERLARRVGAVACISEELGAEVRRLGFTGPVWSIPNFRDPARFADIDRPTANRDLRTRIGVPPEAPIVGWVGHLAAQKRPDRALDVFARVREHHPDAHLVMAGDGPERERVAGMVADYGLGAAVHLLGPLDDVGPVLGGIDVFLLTSDDEGVPGVLIEALMAGCAVVTTPVGGVPGMIDDDRTGLIAADGSPAVLAVLVGDLLADPDRAENLGRAARVASGRWAANAVADEYGRRLRELLGPGSPPGP